MADEPDPVRVDLWLWAARLSKTRPLAADAVKGGHVQVNGVRVKPSKEVHTGDRVEVVRGELRTEVIVRATSRRRGPAAVAALLYEETAESLAERERRLSERRLEGTERSGARPTKRDRRRLDATRRGRGG